MCKWRIFTPTATDSNSFHVWPWYWISEANPRMLKTKSSHIASMYDDLYQNVFFLFRWNSKIRGSFVTSDQRKISQLPISVLSLEKKTLSLRYLPGFFNNWPAGDRCYARKLSESILWHLYVVYTLSNTRYRWKKRVIKASRVRKSVTCFNKKKKHLETNFANFFILQLRWRCSLVGPWKVCGVSMLCLWCGPPRATNSHTSRKASPLHAGICDITKTTESTQGCYRVRTMHRRKGMSFDPNQWQKSRPGKRVCNKRIISMYDGITTTAT